MVPVHQSGTIIMPLLTENQLTDIVDMIVDDYGTRLTGGDGKLDRFNRVFWTKLLPVSLNLESTSSRSQDGKTDPQILFTRVT
jgi:hypothetical protein